jgi:hypothetical protein
MDLFEEIRKDIVQSKYEHFWSCYGKYAIVILLLIILLLSGYFLLHEYKNNKSIKYTNQLYSIVSDIQENNQQDFLVKIDDILINDRGNYRAYAILKKADYELQNKRISVAYELLMNLYKNSKAYKPYRDYAELMLNYIVFKYPTQNDLDNQIIEKITIDNIFYYQIIQIRALCFIENDNFVEAKNELSKILNASMVDAEIKQMAQEIMKLLELVK